MLTTTIQLKGPATDDRLARLVGTRMPAKFSVGPYPQGMGMSVTVVAAEPVPDEPNAALLTLSEPYPGSTRSDI